MTYKPQLDKNSAADTTPGYLSSKLVAGNNISLTTNNGGSNETLTIAADDPAGSKLTELTEVTTPALTDIVYIVVDPGGTPLSRKVTLTNLGTALDIASALEDLTDVDTTGTGTGDILYNGGSGWVDYALGIASTLRNSGGIYQIGSAENYFQINSTGSTRLIGTATQWDDLRLAGSSARLGATAPTLAAFGPSGSIKSLRFDSGQHDEIYFEIQMPHAWREGSNIYPHVHWSPVSATAGNIVWQLDYIWANIGDAFGAPTTMTSDAAAAGGTAWVHKLSALKDGSSNAYIDGTGKTLSSMLICRLHRDAGAGSDTLAADVAFLEFDLHYEVDSFGSDEEYIKDNTYYLTDSDGQYLTDSGGVYLEDSEG